MVARRVKPGVLKIINKPFDESMIESYTLLNVSEEDALALLFASINIEKEDETTFVIKYENDELVSKMYKAIAHKHKENNPDFIDVSVRYELDMDAIPGTSVLVRDPEKQTIKVAYRKSTNFSKACNINRLFINNAQRDSFFRDVKNGSEYKKTEKYVLSSVDKETYSKWSSFMNDRYFEIVTQLKKGSNANA